MAAELVAGALLSASLQVLFERLGSEEIPQLFRGKKLILDQLYELKTMLWSAHALLNDAEEKQLRNQEIRMWLIELQDVIYQADDLVDRIDYEALRSKLEDDQSSSSSASKVLMKFMPPFLSTFDKTVKLDSMEILRKLKILVDQKDALGLREGAQNKPSPRPPAPLVEHANVYGRDTEKKIIVDQLLKGDVDSGSNVSVIPIVGMGGLGKTTLAQVVYDDDRVQKYFELKVWITVSDEFDIFKITKEIFEGVTTNKCGTENFDELRRKLKEALRGKKFLFVHDDVWNESYSLWDTLKSSFESGANGSKILVTTRSTIVASTMATGQVHHLQSLLNEDCWQLFVKHAFGSNFDHNSNKDLQALGRKIVEKCKGLPLAIKSLGGLLRCEQNPKKWEDILGSDTWEELYKKEGSILPALWLSYRHLPTHLKQCFAYCSIFPKDYEFERDRLILLWMAEGFLPMDSKSKKMEEFGKEYLEDLLSRSFFQCSSKNASFLQMHDLVHDLAMLVSDDFCFRLDLSSDMHSLPTKIRHLSYRKSSYDLDKLKGLSKAISLRTFLALPLQLLGGPKYLAPYNILLTKGSCLRVLSLSESSIKELPDSIGSLIHLRYLDLSFTGIEELHESVCSLYHLQTLLLSRCTKLSQLPRNMGRLINLRYLDITEVPLKEMPQGISQMKCLQFLSSVVLSDKHKDDVFKITDLAELEHLSGSLCILGLENINDAMEVSKANLKDKKDLLKLSLRWSYGAVDADSSQKELDVLDALRPHTSLKSLKIESYRGDGIDSSGPLFTCLESLYIWNMLMWKEWSFGTEAILQEGQVFPLLKVLWLRNCPKLNVGLPGYLPSLESLSIGDCEEMEYLLPRTQQTATAPPFLHYLFISHCPVLESLLDWGSHSKLKTLYLWNTKVLFENRIKWDLQKLSRLEEINIRGWENDSFPDEGLLPITLTTIWIENCSKLETLNGKAFQQLTSLTSLEIRSCKSLRCLPEEGLPTSLTELHIYGCPLLNQRCEKGGEDWPKIQHITHLSINKFPPF
ncbi:putative disease resistance RPP13-like protein 1 isoform X2 [Humulus lupulus]|uniref:putative disease resistance RPP13-like protein 1 isoform X2 n=1 Tax=Humulus lupulus TaxID=3486 RepID=UPI002B41364E|nr:putative disease resistance RPP13-like protein 1 isoform X2 [Humulus lupulus]